VYELGTVKPFHEYPVKSLKITKKQILDVFDRALIPNNIADRIKNKLGEQSEYTIEELDSLLNNWHFFDDVYGLGKKAANAILNESDKEAKVILEQIKKNIEVATSSKNSIDDWASDLQRFIDDLTAYVKKPSETTKQKALKSYEEIKFKKGKPWFR
jgi:ribosomal protein S13